ncbi:MAG: type II toxin-antitoxin system VapC family toxin [Planctomycetes bacterium]|nr:type II toxin-antitoxin system VapC family toxin [Planctomycetota bacterium]
MFADSFYYLALMNPDDQDHQRAHELSETLWQPTVTTVWVLTEVADAHAEPALRPNFLTLLALLRADPACTVLPPSSELFESGLRLFSERPDRAWPLTDCISFAAMDRLGISEALTGDHHFEQAGFRILFQ